MTTLDIEPTSVCDLDCPFCFGPIIRSRRFDLSIETWKRALEEFFRVGVRRLVVSGGEPTLFPDLASLLEFARDIGFFVVVSTHGRNQEVLEAIAPFLDWLAFPIDATSNVLTRRMRTDDYPPQDLLRFGHQLKARFPSLRVKIGTVATQLNIKEIGNVGAVLEEFSHSWDTWKIYQFTPRRKRVLNREALELPDDVFLAAAHTQVERFLSKKNVVVSSNLSRKGAYVFVYHTGQVTLVNRGSDFSDLEVGNIEEFRGIDFLTIERELLQQHRLNFESTYFGSVSDPQE